MNIAFTRKNRIMWRMRIRWLFISHISKLCASAYCTYIRHFIRRSLQYSLISIRTGSTHQTAINISSNAIHIFIHWFVRSFVRSFIYTSHITRPPNISLNLFIHLLAKSAYSFSTSLSLSPHLIYRNVLTQLIAVFLISFLFYPCYNALDSCIQLSCLPSRFRISSSPFPVCSHMVSPKLLYARFFNIHWCVYIYLYYYVYVCLLCIYYTRDFFLFLFFVSFSLVFF